MVMYRQSAIQPDFTAAEPFDIETGLPLNKKKKANYQDVFSTCMVKLGQRNEKVVAITAAMPDGTGLKRFKNIYRIVFLMWGSQKVMQ